MAQADNYLFVPDFGVTLVSLRHDSVVTRENTDVAFSYFTGQNPAGPQTKDPIPNSDFLVSSSFDYFAAPGAGIGKVDHLTELPFMSVLILNEFNTAPQFPTPRFALMRALLAGRLSAKARAQ